MRFFSFRDRTEKEAREKLKKKGISEETIEAAIGWLKGEGLLNDESFARQWVEGRKERYGRIRLYKELLQKGVKADVAKDAVTQVLDEEEELDKAIALGRRRLDSVPGDDPRRREKLASFLLRRGFSWEIVEKALRFLFPSP
ncbi:regulatory protein RecX [bacterium]|nr:regulatory protein RecX [bacterium]